MRKGILAAGNFIRDYVKVIDAYPEQDNLASILAETSANGGGPYNVLKDLAALGASFPLEAAGLIGADDNGEWILQDCARAGIHTGQLRQTADAATSYTDAMTVADTGRRTFFHQRGANALFTEQDVDFGKSQAGHLHLGYLMLLDAMDSFASEGRTRASLLLESARKAGLTTSVDLVSASHAQYRQIVESALPFTDLLIVNELEAGRASGLDLRPHGTLDLTVCEQALRHLKGKGVGSQVVIHYVEGAAVLDENDNVHFIRSLKLPSHFIKGATGAGDAFAAGYLLGWYESQPVPACLELAVCAAAACLSDPTPSGGLRPAAECRKLLSEYGYASD